MEPPELDVRTVPRGERHALIFATFDRLASGEALVLVNDHDPTPLYLQFQAERPGLIGWEPQEEGPERWAILIRKVRPAGLDIPADPTAP